jgi:hypothetical protein
LFILGLVVSSLLFERPIAEAFWMPLVRLLMAVPAGCWVVFKVEVAGSICKFSRKTPICVASHAGNDGIRIPLSVRFC